MSKYVPYHAPSIAYAKQLTKGLPDKQQKYQVITTFISRTIGYDFVKAATINKKVGSLPDVAGCWNKRVGICLDIAALTTGMLRAVGIQAYLVIGHADRNYHAWVEARINGKTIIYDHDNPKGKAITYKKERVY